MWVPLRITRLHGRGICQGLGFGGKDVGDLGTVGGGFGTEVGVDVILLMGSRLVLSSISFLFADA
jgi:hypothetical protein